MIISISALIDGELATYVVGNKSPNPEYEKYISISEYNLFYMVSTTSGRGILLDRHEVDSITYGYADYIYCDGEGYYLGDEGVDEIVIMENDAVIVDKEHKCYTHLLTMPGDDLEITTVLRSQL